MREEGHTKHKGRGKRKHSNTQDVVKVHPPLQVVTLTAALEHEVDQRCSEVSQW